MNKKKDNAKTMSEHTKLRYEECYAKTILEYYFKDEFSNLIIQDRPDLYDANNDIGIEVTEACSEEYKEAQKLWASIPYKDTTKQQKSIERMKQLGIEYNGMVQLWPTIVMDNGIESSTFIPLFDAIQKKLEKLNKKGLYKQCKNYYLFVLMELWPNDEWIDVLVGKIKEVSSNYELQYSKIYIYFLEVMICIDLKKLYYKTINIEAKQEILSRNSFAMMKNGEKNEQT